MSLPVTITLMVVMVALGFLMGYLMRMHQYPQQAQRLKEAAGVNSMQPSPTVPRCAGAGCGINLPGAKPQPDGKYRCIRCVRLHAVKV